MKLVKDGKGNYFSADRGFWLERCLRGWDVYELFNDGKYHYSFSVDTLKEFRLIQKYCEGGEIYS